MRGKKKADERATEWRNKAFKKQGIVNALNDQVVEFMSVNKQHEGIIDHYWASQKCINNSNKEMQKLRVEVNRNGGARWEVWVVLLCCKLLVVWVATSAIPQSIMTMYGTIYGKHPRQVLSKNYVRQCRSIIECFGETIEAIKLAQSKSWDQIFFNAITRRKMPFQALIIGVLDGKKHLEKLVVSYCIY